MEYLTRRRRRGVICVEMAVLLPLLIVLLLGLLEYGWLFTKAHQITNIARNGARLAALPDSTVADVQAQVTNQMAAVGLAGKYTLSISPANISALDSGQALSVTVTAPWSGVSLFNCALLPGPDSLGASVVMAKEGP